MNSRQNLTLFLFFTGPTFVFCVLRMADDVLAQLQHVLVRTERCNPAERAEVCMQMLRHMTERLDPGKHLRNLLLPQKY